MEARPMKHLPLAFACFALLANVSIAGLMIVGVSVTWLGQDSARYCVGSICWGGGARLP